MYGGDEVSAIVVDLGTHTCKAGYAGEDAPKAVFPSVVGSIDQLGIDDVKFEKDSESIMDTKNASVRNDSDKNKAKRKLYVGSQALGYRRDNMEVLSAMKDGVVVDWDIVDTIWDHAFRERLLIDPTEHPMLLAEPSSNTLQQRERTAELMFEKYKVPALFLAKNAVLTSFASGRATSLVVDSGGGSTTVAPVHDGYVLQKAVATSAIGGEFLTECMMKSLESKGITMKPRYSLKRKEIRPGEFQTVDLDFPNTTESYKLYSQTIPGMEGFADSASFTRGLPQMVIESINKCDVGIRRELFCSILESPQAARLKVLASGNATERQFRFLAGVHQY